jgi:hypothetical protein
VAENGEWDHPTAISSQAIRYSADFLPGFRDLAGFYSLPLRYFHPGSSSRLLDGTASSLSSLTEEVAEDLAPDLAAEGGGTAGAGN